MFLLRKKKEKKGRVYRTFTAGADGWALGYDSVLEGVVCMYVCMYTPFAAGLRYKVSSSAYVCGV